MLIYDVYIVVCMLGGTSTHIVKVALFTSMPY